MEQDTTRITNFMQRFEDEKLDSYSCPKINFQKNDDSDEPQEDTGEITPDIATNNNTANSIYRTGKVAQRLQLRFPKVKKSSKFMNKPFPKLVGSESPCAIYSPKKMEHPDMSEF